MPRLSRLRTKILSSKEFKMNLNSKLPDVGVTIFTIMTHLANENGAINLSQGFPDFNVPPDLVDRVFHHMRSGSNQYAPMQGVLGLRERISEKVDALYSKRYDPISEITITAGATEAVFAAITAVVGPGDEVILFEPAYDAYVPAIRLNGGIPVPLKLRFPAYRIDWNEVMEKVSSKTRAIILNSPHNPTGSILDETDTAALIEIVQSTDIVLISDEVYEHIIFDGLRHESICRYPELSCRSFVISSFGKTYHATGWKVGYCVAPKPLSEEFQKIHQYLTFAVNTPVQLAYADYLPRRQAYLELGAFYQKKRDAFLESIKTSRFKVIPSRGTYFQMLDYSAVSDEPDTVFAERLTTQYGVAAIPPSVFYHDHEDNRVLRFCFAKKEDTLKEAGERLCRI